MTAEQMNAIRARLAAVEKKPWKYNPAKEMFVGTTHALETWHGDIDLGRSGKQWYQWKDETGSGWKLTEQCVRNMARIKALGEFLENSREDMAALLARIDELEKSLFLAEDPYCPECGSCGETGCCGVKRCKYLAQHQGDYDTLCKDNERMRAALEPFVRYIRARLEVLGTNSEKSYPDLLVAGVKTADLLKKDWEGLLAVIPEAAPLAE